MADDLEISASYVALLERNQRPVTADMLLRLARTYRLEIEDIAGDHGEDYARRVTEVLRDPIFSDIDLPALEVADLATSFPGVSEALLRLHGAYVREQQALAERRAGGENGDEPVREVQQFIAARRNYFDTLDKRAEALAVEVEKAGGGHEWLASKGIRVRYMPAEVLMDSLRRFDRHNQQLLIADALDGPSRAFQIATQIAHTALRAEIREEVRSETFSSRNTSSLAARALAGYAAAAIRMPYSRFARAAEQRKYDIEALCGLFGVSFEQAAHRLTTLQRPGDNGLGFFFIRVDEAGNVSKRLDGAGFPFAAHGGGCPLWNVHQAFRRPGEVMTQRLELPGGERFFSIARTVTGGGPGFLRRRVLRAVALACPAEHADRLIYAQAMAETEVTPIGVTCRLCQRAECTARAVPPIGRDVVADDYRRTAQPYLFADN